MKMCDRPCELQTTCMHMCFLKIVEVVIPYLVFILEIRDSQNLAKLALGGKPSLLVL